MILVTETLNAHDKITRISNPKVKNIRTEIELFS